MLHAICQSYVPTNVYFSLFPSASATIGFSQASYTAMEGGRPVSICIVVVSLVNQLTESAFIGFSNSEVSDEFSFNEASVGDEVLCQSVSIADDNVVEPRELRIFTAFIEAPPSITFASGRDSATLNIIDNDRMFLVLSMNVSKDTPNFKTLLSWDIINEMLSQLHRYTIICPR